MPQRKKMTDQQRIGLLEGRLDKRDTLLGLALFTAVLCLITAIVSGSVAIDARSTARNSEQVSQENRDISLLIHASQIQACQRGNRQRVSTIQNLKADASRLEREIVSDRADRDHILMLTPAITGSGQWADTKDAEIRSKRAGIRFKQHTINEQIASISEFAVEPGSAKVDCFRAYPR